MGDLENKAEDLTGKAKEKAGEVFDNENLADEGRADQTKAQVKDALSEVGEKLENAKDKVLGAFQKDEK